MLSQKCVFHQAHNLTGVPGMGLDRALAAAPWLGAAVPCASRPRRLLAANARAASCSDAAAGC